MKKCCLKERNGVYVMNNSCLYDSWRMNIWKISEIADSKKSLVGSIEIRVFSGSFGRKIGFLSMRPFNKIIFSNGTRSRFIIQFSHYRFIIIFICISTWRNRMLSKLSLPLGRESSTSRTIKYLLRTKPHSVFSLIFQSERRSYQLLSSSFLCPWFLPIAIVFDRTVLLLVLCLIL